MNSTNHTFEKDEDCPCQPTIIPVKREDGSIGYVIAHNEPSQTPAELAERTEKIFEAMYQVRYDCE